MYTEFFGFIEKPFELTPSPRFLYMSESHREALALLTYGVTEQKGFVLLTGEVGTGKTTMVHTLLSSLDQNINHVFLSNPLLSGQDLLKYVAFSAFGKKVQFKSKAEFLMAFEELLLKNRQHQHKFLLIIDEAQKLSFELLEEIRLFSNLETDEGKLLNIFLIGQPELNQTLSDPQCRPLLQRISIRHHLSPLNLKETREYAATRLRVAGAGDPEGFFHETVIRALHQYSSGYPRLINILADNALLLAYARGKKKVTAAMIKECYEDMQIDSAIPVPMPLPEKEKSGKKLLPRKRRWKWLCAALALFLLVGLALNPKARAELFRIMDALKAKSQALLQGVLIPRGREQRRAIPKSPLPAKDMVPKQAEAEMLRSPPDPVLPEDRREDREAGSMAKDEEPEVEESPPPAAEEAEAAQTQQAPALPETAAGEETGAFQEVTVKRGDTVTQLALNIYGFADDKLLDMIRAHNSHIRDINWISVGQKIVFPPLSGAYQGPTYTVHIATYESFQNAQALFYRLIDRSMEAYIVPVFNAEKGKVYRVAAGSFTKSREADLFGAQILSMGISDFARTIQLEVR